MSYGKSYGLGGIKYDLTLLTASQRQMYSMRINSYAIREGEESSQSMGSGAPASPLYHSSTDEGTVQGSDSDDDDKPGPSSRPFAVRQTTRAQRAERGRGAPSTGATVLVGKALEKAKKKAANADSPDSDADNDTERRDVDSEATQSSESSSSSRSEHAAAAEKGSSSDEDGAMQSEVL